MTPPLFHVKVTINQRSRERDVNYIADRERLVELMNSFAEDFRLTSVTSMVIVISKGEAQ